MTHRKPTLLTAEDIQDNFTDALRLLRSVRRTLSDLIERVADGEDGLLMDIGLKQAELESALKRAFDAEERYNDWQARTAGIQNACEIDFAALREDLACRLQTIRDCCQEGA